MSEQTQTVVVDCGSGVCKAGLAGDDAPVSVFPSAVGRNDNRRYVGSEAEEHTFVKYPIEHGIVENWDDMEEIYNHIFYKVLRVRPEEHPILLSQPPLNPKNNKEKLAEIMFEKFNVPAIYQAVSPVLSLYASGRHAGLIVDIGDGVTSVVPIEGGYPIPEGITRLDLAGRDLTDFLKQKLTLQQLFSIDKKTAQDIKENLCYVALDSDEKPIAKSYKLPDGQNIIVGDDIVSCPEVLFKPKILNKEASGIHEMVCDSIMRCSIDLRRQFAYNIIPVGGSTMFKGFNDRLKTELKAKLPSKMEVNIFTNLPREIAVWIGGSILGSLSTFQNTCLSKSDYETLGASTIHDKFFKAIP